jgi:glycosyltransferase involved in cell wall biosynthesis
MKIVYTTCFNVQDVHKWSGTPYFMSKALAEDGNQVAYIGSLKKKLPHFFKVKQIWKKWISGQRESPQFNLTIAKHYSAQVAEQLVQYHADVIISPLINPIAYLDCKQPIVLWTDALYAGLLGFYHRFGRHTVSTIAQGNEMTSACLSRCALAIFSSDWAANTAIELYGASREKVKVVPFGANIESYPHLSEIKSLIQHRVHDKIKLLFLAKSWERKGGDTVLAVAKTLHEAGHPVELTIVGYTPPALNPIPSYIKCLGFISKHTQEGKEKIRQLLSDTHFLFVPSRAEAYGIVFCEANAFGVPCLTTYVGGISTIVKDNVNGMTFALDAPIKTYCDYIVNVMQDRTRYETLALSAYHEFTQRLNWPTAVRTVKEMIKKL